MRSQFLIDFIKTHKKGGQNTFMNLSDIKATTHNTSSMTTSQGKKENNYAQCTATYIMAVINTHYTFQLRKTLCRF